MEGYCDKVLQYKKEVMKKKKIIICVILVIIVGVFAWCNFINPAIVYEDGEIDFVAGHNDGEEYNRSLFDDLIKEYRGEETDNYINDEELVRTNPELPSTKSEDYISVAIDFEIRNISMFQIDGFTAMVNGEDENSRILYTDSDIQEQYINAFEKKVITTVWLEVYRGDMNDDELTNYLKERKITVYYKNSISGTKSKTVQLSECNVDWKGFE